MTAACSTIRSFGSAILAKQLEADLRSTRRRARRLVRAGALLEPEEDRYLRAPELAPIGRLYALEAKVDDWSVAASPPLAAELCAILAAGAAVVDRDNWF